MRRSEIRLYNMIIPVWLLWMFLPLFPWVLPVTLLGNLLIDTAVLFCTLLALGRRDKRRVMKRMWWRIWLRGFAGDAAGVGWLLLGAFSAVWIPDSGWAEAVNHVMYDPLGHPAAFLWTLVGVVLSGVCIYAMDRVTLEWEGDLTDREARTAALTLAIVTAPWTFFIPMG